jgi:hypothetical protein
MIDFRKGCDMLRHIILKYETKAMFVLVSYFIYIFLLATVCNMYFQILEFYAVGFFFHAYFE